MTCANNERLSVPYRLGNVFHSTVPQYELHECVAFDEFA